MATFLIFPIIKSFVQASKLKVAREDNDSVIVVFGKEDSERVDDYALVLTAREEQNDFSVKCVCCEFAVESKRRRIAELFGRINYKLA